MASSAMSIEPKSPIVYNINKSASGDKDFAQKIATEILSINPLGESNTYCGMAVRAGYDSYYYIFVANDSNTGGRGMFYGASFIVTFAGNSSSINAYRYNGSSI